MKKILIRFLSFCLFLFSSGITANEVLRFGIESYYPPFVFKDAMGHFYGFDIAIAKAICEQLNKKCTFTPMPFNSLFTALNNKEVDAIISAISITSEREKSIAFTIPYYRGTMSFVTLSNKKFSIQQGLKGKKIGVVRGTLFYQYLKENYPKSKPINYDTPQDAIADLINNDIDGILLDTINANWWVDHSANQMVISSEALPVPGGGGYGIGVRKNDPNLLNTLNAALNAIFANGKYQQIVKMYLQL